MLTLFIEKSFGGMKKGFLSNNSKSTELIEISRKKPEETKDFRVFDEVQQAIKEEQQSKSWKFCFYFLIQQKIINYR